MRFFRVFIISLFLTILYEKLDVLAGDSVCPTLSIPLPSIKGFEECSRNFYSLSDGICFYESPLYSIRQQWCLTNLTKLPNVRFMDFICAESTPPCSCYEWTNMHCVGLGLTSIPNNIDEQVTWFHLNENQLSEAITNTTFLAYRRINFLDLSDNHLKKLQPFSFQNLSELLLLNLENNQIKELKQNIFYGLNKLNGLHLSNNYISKYDENVFSNLKKLEFLSLSKNQIFDIRKTLFQELYELRVLFLNENKMNELTTSSFQGLTQLLLLDLESNFIHNIMDDAFEGLDNLWILNLRNNSLMSLKSDMFLHLGSLYALKLSRNKISAIQNQSFNVLNYLNTLDLSENHLTELKLNMFQNLNDLEILYLNHNNISNIQEYSFNDLQNLRKLNFLCQVVLIKSSTNLSDNQLTILRPEMFRGLKHIETLTLSFNGITTIEDNTFKELENLSNLKLNNNKLKSLSLGNFIGSATYLQLQWNEISTIEEFTLEDGQLNLKALYLDHNNLTNLASNAFRNLRTLESLQIGYNQINTIEEETFHGFKNLLILDLQNNKLTTLTTRMIQDLQNLGYLRLQFNKIENIKDLSFYGLRHLLEIKLRNNKITELPPCLFKELNECRPNLGRHMIQNCTPYIWPLYTLDLQYNRIAKLTETVFENLKNLFQLNLNNNKIKIINNFSFKGLKKLNSLWLNNNEITQLTDNTFRGLDNLENLEIQNNHIGNMERNVFKANPRLIDIISDEHRFCCLVKNARCEPAPDEFSSCEDLMANSILRICIWILGIIAIFNNIYVIILRSRKNQNKDKVHSFLIKNLALSDLFMGIYLLIIASSDLYFRGNYFLYDFGWRTSCMCNFAGFLSTFSSELTVFTLTIITLDRLFAIKFPFRTRQREINRTRFLMAIAWILAIIIAMIPLPLFQMKYFDNFYGRSGVCLPLHITSDKPNGWKYSVFVFIVLNALSFVVIVSSYILMYWSASKTQQAITSTNNAQSTKMAFRMTLLITADAACWIPIIVLGIRSLCGYSMMPNVYAWIAVFVLPLNAALNPILYTLTSIVRPYGSIKFRCPCYLERKNRPQITN